MRRVRRGCVEPEPAAATRLFGHSALPLRGFTTGQTGEDEAGDDHLMRSKLLAADRQRRHRLTAAPDATTRAPALGTGEDIGAARYFRAAYCRLRHCRGPTTSAHAPYHWRAAPARSPASPPTMTVHLVHHGSHCDGAPVNDAPPAAA